MTKLFCILVVMEVTQLHAFVKIGRNERESGGGGGIVLYLNYTLNKMEKQKECTDSRGNFFTSLYT